MGDRRHNSISHEARSNVIIPMLYFEIRKGARGFGGAVRKGFLELTMKLFPDLSLLARSSRMNDGQLATDPEFLSHAFSQSRGSLERGAWNTFSAVRWFLVLGALIRFLISNALFPPLHGSPTSYSHLTYRAYGIPLSLWGALVVFVGIESWIARLPFKHAADSSAGGRLIKAIFAVELFACTLLYSSTRNPYSDVAFCLLVPFAFVAEFLSFRSALRRLRALPIALLVGGMVSNATATAFPLPKTILFVNVVGTRTVLMCVVILGFLYGRRSARAGKAVIQSIVNALPGGMAVVAKDSGEVCWANAPMRAWYMGERKYVGKDSGDLSDREAGIPKDYYSARLALPDLKRYVPVRNAEDSSGELTVWTETLQGQLQMEGRVVGSIELVRDVTCREVLQESISRLETCTSESEVVDAIIQGLRAVGYRRCRVYLLSSDGRELVGVRAAGMPRESFEGFRLPRFGESCSELTLGGSQPRVFEPESPDLNCRRLEKDPGLPWIESPMRLGDRVFGKISLDNKGHPQEERRQLLHERRFASRVAQSELLTLLHTMSIQACYALQRCRIGRERIDLLATYVHFSVRYLVHIPLVVDNLKANLSGWTDRENEAAEEIIGLAMIVQMQGARFMQWAQDDRSGEHLAPTRDLSNIYKLIEDVVGWYSYITKALQIAISIECGKDMTFNIDAKMVQHILCVFIGNSIDSIDRVYRVISTRAGQIAVAGRVINPSTLEFSVLDNGKGLTAVEERLLYERHTPSPGGSKLGCGLRIARYLANSHGGQVFHRNNVEGEGVEFVCRISLS